MRVLVCLLLGIPLLAGEYAVLGNGFRLHADRHVTAGDRVTLFIGDGQIELPAGSIVAFEPDDYVPPAKSSADAPKAPAPTTPRELVDHAAKRYGLPPEFLESVAAVESGYRANAVSPKGAIGIMQLMPATAAELNADPNDPAQNVDAGARHLSKLLIKYNGGLYHALAAYNAGEGAVARYGGIPPYPETRLYVERVLKHYRELRRDRQSLHQH